MIIKLEGQGPILIYLENFKYDMFPTLITAFYILCTLFHITQPSFLLSRGKQSHGHESHDSYLPDIDII